jgi:hypothetical protein
MKRFSVTLLGVVMLAAGYGMGRWVEAGVGLPNPALAWLCITFAGAFGGMLYTFRDGGLEIPHKVNGQHRYNLGWISDCLYGIAGAYVVFLLVPMNIGSESDFDPLIVPMIDQIKFFALALVGGYGGRSLVDRALANMQNKIDQVQQAAEKAAAEKETDALALELVQRHLDEEEEAQPLDQLKNKISAASRGVRFDIFKQARAVRTSTWDNDPPLMARTIPIFEALIDNDAGESFHRNHAQLGYALKDRGGPNSPDNDWQGAYNQLSIAIRLRDEQGTNLRRSDGSPAFLMYEFNRAICAVKLSKDTAGIVADLQVACARKSLHEAILGEKLFSKWAKIAKVDLEVVTQDGSS